MNDQLHPARFVEEPFHEKLLLGRNQAKSFVNGAEIVGQLPGGDGGDFRLGREPGCDLFDGPVRLLDDILNFVAQF
jgi:hypothetical protein